MFLRILLGLILSQISLSVFAADYYWLRQTDRTTQYKSPREACPPTSTSPSYWDAPAPLTEIRSAPGSNPGTIFNCIYKAHYSAAYGPDAGDHEETGIAVDRQGNSCPEGATFNVATGTCDKPSEGPCADKKGKVVKSFRWLSTTDEPSSTISVDGCAAAISGFSICKTASPSVFSCSGTATWSGEELKPTNGSGSECTGDECHKDDPQDETKNEPCIKQDTGAGYTCTSKIEDSKTGETSCGTANGVYVCTPSVKPAKTSVSQSVQQVQTPNSDGSLSTKNVTTTTKTTCVADKCTTTSYKTTTNAGTGANGMPTGSSTTCTGSDCPSQTGSGTVGGGGGGGNSKEDGTASASKDCAKPVQCDGDTYQCAILNQEFISMCSLKEGPTDKDLADLKASTAAYQAKAEANQSELDSTANGVLSQFRSAASTGGGSVNKCLPDYSDSIMGHSISLKFSSVCEYLSGIRYAILAICYLIAARRMSREL